jgi:general L-amino acid transport system permease protein
MAADRSFLEPGLGEPLLTVEEELPREDLTPRQWLRKRLFNNWYNSAITIVLLVVISYLAWRAFMFLFVTARWSPVRQNLTLFMVGRFPRDEMWRITAQMILWSSAAGLAWGAAIAGAKFRALRAGMTYTEDPVLHRVRRYWGILFLIALILTMTRTFGPLILFAAAVSAGAVLQYLGSRVPGPFVGLLWSAVGVLWVAGFQVVSGFYGNGWVWMGVPVAGAFLSLLKRVDWQSALSRRLVLIGGVTVVFSVMALVYTVVDHRGVGWDRWEGLRLNLTAAPLAIVLAFPLGLMLALARRSSFPALRIVATVYIELIRGVPLISLLLMGQFFIGFFLNTTTPLSSLTRAITALTLFTAAYIAEIVRGGLQSVPRGQIEAGQSVGLSAFKITRLIVLPQALRAVIPAMVGQFIALFKDTTLLFIISVAEILTVRSIVHAQADFRGFGIAETMVFVMFAFWAVAFTMSRESQRLERKLGVGER